MPLQAFQDVADNYSNHLSFLKYARFGLVLLSAGDPELAVHHSSRSLFIHYNNYTTTQQLLSVLIRLQIALLNSTPICPINQGYESSSVQQNLQEWAWLYSYVQSSKATNNRNIEDIMPSRAIQSIVTNDRNDFIDPILRSRSAALLSYFGCQPASTPSYLDINAIGAAIDFNDFNDFTKYLGLNPQMIFSINERVQPSLTPKRIIITESPGFQKISIDSKYYEQLGLTMPDAMLDHAEHLKQHPLFFREHDVDFPIGIINNPFICDCNHDPILEFNVYYLDEVEWSNRNTGGISLSLIRSNCE